tara:strand:+ start:5541 stop:6410 length:870 start_codon:yes stop_codon:yes gene_type:complete
MKKKKIETLVEDIYKVIGSLAEDKPIKISEAEYEEFGKAMSDALRHWATPSSGARDNIRMSNVGRPLRRLWYELKSPDLNNEKMSSPLFIKFLYGHLLEVLVLFFTKLAGHEVTDEQKEIKVLGVKGHMDCKIDGQVIDVKSASGYSFKKFKEGTLGENDSFGYLSQLAGYEYAEKTSKGGFLVMNKETGELTTFIPDDLDKPNITTKIKKVKKAIASDTPPELCYEPIPEGSYGNMKLPRDCTYCPFKFECHKDANDGQGLRVFAYAKGNTYFTKVEREPNVEEIKIL